MNIEQQIKVALRKLGREEWTNFDGEEDSCTVYEYNRITEENCGVIADCETSEMASIISNFPEMLRHQATIISQQSEQIERLKNMVEIVLYHYPKVGDRWEEAYEDLKSQITVEYEKNPWIEVPNVNP